MEILIYFHVAQSRLSNELATKQQIMKFKSNQQSRLSLPSSFMLPTLPNVKYSRDEIKELDLKTSSQKVNHDKITAFDWPEGKWGGGGGRKEPHGFHGEGRRGGGLKN